MNARRVACNSAFSTPSCIFPAEGQHISTVTAPVRPNVRNGFEPMWYTVIDLVFIVLLSTCRVSSDSYRIQGKRTPVDFDMHFVTTFS